MVKFPTVPGIDGSRTPGIFFPAGTTADFTPSGGVYTLRSVDYTATANGPKMMPGTLPPQSAYTYAVDFSIDEAGGAPAHFSNSNSANSTFNNTIFFYVDNFLALPTGTTDTSGNHIPLDVPVGVYDLSLGQWVPSANGVILTVVSVTSGKADISITGTPGGGSYSADSAATLATVGITDDERIALVSTYGSGVVGKSFWRVPTTHFSIFDCNWGYVLPTGAAPPPLLPPFAPLPPDDPCTSPGSIIECQSQILAEQIPIYGTPYSLRYQSDRVPGRLVKFAIPVVGSSPPPSSLSRIDVIIDVAGRHQVVSGT
jgi:hypothetical protein